MIALLCLLEQFEVAVQCLLGLPGGSVDPLQARVGLVTAPVRRRASGELERRNVFGGRGVRAAAQIAPNTFAGARIEVVVGGQLVVGTGGADLHHVRIPGFVIDQFELVGLIGQLGAGGVGGLIHPPGEQLTVLDDGLHPLLELLEVLRRERLRHVEVVVEAVGDRRADAQLGRRKKLLHGLGQHVGCRVPDHAAALVAVSGHRGDLGVGIRRPTQIAQRAVGVTDHHDRGGLATARQTRVAHGGPRGGPGRNPQKVG